MLKPQTKTTASEKTWKILQNPQTSEKTVENSEQNSEKQADLEILKTLKKRTGVRNTKF